MPDDYCHWGDYKKSLQLAIHLRGTAQGVLADLRQDQRTNFTSLTSALAARFEPVQQSELHRVKLKTRVRREGETLPELAQDVNKLIRLAYPSATADIYENSCQKTASLTRLMTLIWNGLFYKENQNQLKMR